MDNATLVLTGTPQVAAGHGIAYFEGRDSRVLYWIRRPNDAPTELSSNGEVSVMAHETFVTVPRGFNLYLAGEGVCYVQSSAVDMQLDTDDFADDAKTGEDEKIVTGTEGSTNEIAIWSVDGDLISSGTDISDVILGNPGADGNISIWNAEGELVDGGVSATDLVVGTSGTNGNLVAWNATGEAVDSGVGASTILVDSDIGSGVQGFDAMTMKSDEALIITATHEHSVVAGGVQSSGTYAPDTSTSSVFSITNGGAFALGVPAPSDDDVCREAKIFITNNASAGAVDTSAFTQVIGDAFTTTDGDEFLCTITTIDLGGTHKSVLGVTALQ